MVGIIDGDIGWGVLILGDWMGHTDYLNPYTIITSPINIYWDHHYGGIPNNTYVNI